MANPSTVQFPVSLIIDVTIQPTPDNLNVPNINTAALFTNDQPSWIGSQAFKIYTNATDVAADFGDTSNSFHLAVAFFAQQPNPIGTGGYLAIVPRIIGSGETVQAAVLRTLNLVFYFGILVDSEYHSDQSTFTDLADYVQTLQKMLFYASSDATDFASGGLLDLIRQASDQNTRCLYYNDGVAIDTPAFAAAYAGRALSTNFEGSLTTETMNLKSLAGFTPDQTLDTGDLVECQAAGVDVYISIGGVSSLYTSGENGWFDEIYNQFWFGFALQTAGFNYLKTSSTKVPQTEIGMEGLKNVYRQVCQQAVTNGFVAPGSWTSADTFGPSGALVRNVLDQGYYVYAQPITDQSPAERVARQAPLVQIAVKAAGAIHHSDVIVNVNL